MRHNLQVLLAGRPNGELCAEDFLIVENDLPPIPPGFFLVQNKYLSLDPFIRGRMDDKKSYAKPMAMGEVMAGYAVGEIVVSINELFKKGDRVIGNFGWQRFAISNGHDVRKIIDHSLPLSLYLGVMGMPGITGYVGLLDIGKPRTDETVVVTSASGAVGSVVGQIAKIKGCRSVGIAGGPIKCDYVTSYLGFDACIDYKAGNLMDDLKMACPNGIDVCFENVGGFIFDSILFHINPFARIALCGLISQYNLNKTYRMKSMASLLINRASLQGFIISDHKDRWDAAINDLSRWVREGRIKYYESMVSGLENAPSAFIDFLSGKSLGKVIIKLIQ